MTLPSKFAREFELPVGVMPLGLQLDKREFSGGDAIPPLGNACRRCALGMPPLVGIRCTPWPRAIGSVDLVVSRGSSFKMLTAWRSSATAESDPAIDRL